MDWKKNYESKLVSAAEAAKAVESNDRIWLAPACNLPEDIVEELCKRSNELENVTMYSALIMYPTTLLKPEHKGHINYCSFFLGGIERAALNGGNIEPWSTHLSDLSRAAREVIKPNVLISQVSEPDENGYMSHGPTGIIINKLIADMGNKVIVQVNRNCPYIYGEENLIHVSDVDYIYEKHEDLRELPEAPASEIDKKIAEYVIAEIDDEATIQIGIGGTGNAVAYGLEKKKNLGIHTEMFTEAMVHLCSSGAVNGSKKNQLPGKVVCGFAIGSKKMYQFLHKNPAIHMIPLEESNKCANVMANNNQVSINNALEIDLTGQVASEGKGYVQYSGTGGQLDFVKGAYFSKGGKSFLTMSSTYEKNGKKFSKIVSSFKPGTPITTPRSDVQYVVTEYGIVNLKYHTIAERAQLMISIAHPDFRDQLTKEAREAGLIRS